MIKRIPLPVILTIVSVALIVAMAWSLKSFSRYQPYAGLMAPPPGFAKSFSLELTNVDTRGRQAGHAVWSLHAGTITLSPDRRQLTALNLDKGVLLRDGKAFLGFQADQANYIASDLQLGNGSLQVFGRVQLKSIAPLTEFGAAITASADSVEWNAATEMMICPGSFTLHAAAGPKGKVDLRGVALTWDARQRRLNCTGSVIATVSSPQAPNVTTVTAGRLTWTPTTCLLVLPQGATADNPALGTIAASELTVNTRTDDVDSGPVNASTRAVAAMIPPVNGTTDAPPLAKPDKGPTALATDDKPKTNDKGAKSDTDDNRVTYSATQAHWDEQTRILDLKGPVTFRQGDATVKMVGARYDRNTDIATALSPVSMNDPETTLTGDHGQVDFKHHIATLTDNIRISVTPKEEDNKGKGSAPSGSKTPEKQDGGDTSMETEAKEPTFMTCDGVKYDYKAKTADIDGHIVVKQKHRTVTSKLGHYDANAKIVEMDGDVHAVSDEGRTLDTQKARVSVKKGEEWIDIPDSPITGIFDVKPEDNPRPK